MDEHNMNKLVNNINGYCKIIKRIKNEKIIEEIVNIENISFSGFTGEPLIAKKATLLGMKCFTENGKRVGMFTNGTLMNQDTWGVIINIAYVLISIDAGTPKTYSIMKCAGSKIGEDLFYKVINNINLLASRKENLRSKLDINVGFVINQYNYKELYDIAKICKDIGVHYFRIKTDIALNHMLNKEEILKTRECVDKVKYILQDNTFKIVEIHKVDKKRTNIRKFHKCFMHALMGAIGPNGNVYPCNYHSKVNGLHYGNIFMESFREIWENKLNNNLCHNIPNECPITCDPFKMRGNELLSETYKIYNNGNGSFVNYLDDLSKYIFANNYV
jgi:radical SAM protein with 4Fe4S-binding SPASM domain